VRSAGDVLLSGVVELELRSALIHSLNRFIFPKSSNIVRDLLCYVSVKIVRIVHDGAGKFLTSGKLEDAHFELFRAAQQCGKAFIHEVQVQ